MPRSCDLSRRVLVWVSVALMIAMSAGAVPVVHDHELTRADYISSVAARDYQRHLEVFHETKVLSETTAADWHVHWVFPHSPTASVPGCESFAQCEGAPRLVNSDCWFVPQQQLAVERFVVLLPRLPRQVCLEDKSVPHFLAGHDLSLSLPELVGIMRC